MYRFIYLTLALALIMMSGCALGPQPVHHSAIPTIGPVQRSSGGDGHPHLELIANTNCAEVGEVITFTTLITNEMSVPITFIGTPVVDIVLTPFGEKVPPLRWSATAQYPKNLNPMFAPGEARQYQWHWIADATYFQPQKTTANGVIAQLTFGEVIQEKFTPFPQGSFDIYIGIGTHILSMPGSNVTCADMRTATNPVP